MNLLDTASLVVTPNGYKASKLYSIIPSDGTGDMTFARTGDTATRVNSSGLIETVLANKPRLDYLGSTCPKLLLEPQRTNVQIRSQEIDNAAYTKQDVTVLANDAVAPDGTTTADKVYPTTSGSARQFYKSTAISTGVAHTSSVFAKAGGKNIFVMFTIEGDNGAFFDLSNGTISNVRAGSTATITAYANGWYRCTLTTTSVTTAGYVGALLVNSTSGTSVTTNGTDGVYFWGFQLEAGNYATSYIPTTTASVTRVGDTFSKTSISSLIGQTEGTFFAHLNLITSNAYGASRLSLSSNSADNWIFIGNESNSLRYYFRANNAVIFGNTQVTNGDNKVAIAYKSGNSTVYVNGVQVLTNSSSFAFSSSVAALLFSAYNESAGDDTVKLNSVALWKTRLQNAELATLTTI